MKIYRSIFALLIIFIGCAFIQKENKADIIEEGAVVEKLASGFLFTEGPSADSDGNVYFTDQPNDRIMVWSVTGELSTFLQPCGRSNGLAFDNNGFLWACADEKNELWKISPDKDVTVIRTNYMGKPLNGPNDLWITADGGIYFTDPFYARPWWDHNTMPQDLEGVYYISSDNKKVIRVADDLMQPNGIVGTPDGKTIFIADIKANKTWSYSIMTNGSLAGKKLFCNLGSDGMTIDTQGNIYLTGNGVTIFNKEGQQIEHIEVPEGWTANVCFGDPDMKSLFITASKGLYRIRMKVKGTAG